MDSWIPPSESALVAMGYDRDFSSVQKNLPRLRPWGRRRRDGPRSSSTADCSGGRSAWSSISERPRRAWVQIVPHTRPVNSMDGGGVLVSLGGDLAVAGQSPRAGGRSWWPRIPSVTKDRPGPRRTVPPRWRGHVLGRMPSLAPGRPHVASHHRPTHGRAGARPLAHGDGGRTHVCPRQRCVDGSDRRGRRGTRRGQRCRTAGALDRARRFDTSGRILAAPRRRRTRRSRRGPSRPAGHRTQGRSVSAGSAVSQLPGCGWCREPAA